MNLKTLSNTLLYVNAELANLNQRLLNAEYWLRRNDPDSATKALEAIQDQQPAIDRLRREITEASMDVEQLDKVSRDTVMQLGAALGLHVGRASRWHGAKLRTEPDPASLDSMPEAPMPDETSDGDMERAVQFTTAMDRN